MDWFAHALNRFRLLNTLPAFSYLPSIRFDAPTPNPLEMAHNVPEQYINWDDCHEAVVVKKRHVFCPMEDLLAFVEDNQFAAYYVHTVRVHIVDAARQLKTDAPFGRNMRFPDDRDYVDLDHPSICGPLTQLLAACELPDRHINASSGQGGNGHLNDAKRSFDTGFAALRTLVKETRASRMTRNGIYSRASFEARFGLIWGAPQPNPQGAA